MPAPRVAAASDKRLRPRNRVRSATTPFLSCGGDGVTRFADDTAMLTRLLICLLAVDFLHSVCEQARTQNRSRDRFLISLALPSVSWTNTARAVGSYSGMYLQRASIKTPRRTLAAYCWYGLPLQWREEGGRRDLNERIVDERSVLGHLGLSRRLFILQIASLSRSSTARSIADSRGMAVCTHRARRLRMKPYRLEAFLQTSGHGIQATHPYEA